MKIFILLVLVFIFTQSITQAQELWFTRTGRIEFHAGTALEDIDAVNNEVTSVLNTATHEIAFTVLIKSFHFRRALMEEHFNENYMESTTYPKSTFKGKIVNPENVKFGMDGQYKVTIEGDLLIHGITKKIRNQATFSIKNRMILGTTVFKIKPADYNIRIPGIVADKIAEEVDVSITCQYEPRK